MDKTILITAIVATALTMGLFANVARHVSRKMFQDNPGIRTQGGATVPFVTDVGFPPVLQASTWAPFYGQTTLLGFLRASKQGVDIEPRKYDGTTLSQYIRRYEFRGRTSLKLNNHPVEGGARDCLAASLDRYVAQFLAKADSPSDPGVVKPGKIYYYQGNKRRNESTHTVATSASKDGTRPETCVEVEGYHNTFTLKDTCTHDRFDPLVHRNGKADDVLQHIRMDDVINHIPNLNVLLKTGQPISAITTMPVRDSSSEVHHRFIGGLSRALVAGGDSYEERPWDFISRGSSVYTVVRHDGSVVSGSVELQRLDLHMVVHIIPRTLYPNHARYQLLRSVAKQERAKFRFGYEPFQRMDVETFATVEGFVSGVYVLNPLNRRKPKGSKRSPEKSVSEDGPPSRAPPGGVELVLFLPEGMTHHYPLAQVSACINFDFTKKAITAALVSRGVGQKDPRNVIGARDLLCQVVNNPENREKLRRLDACFSPVDIREIKEAVPKGAAGAAENKPVPSPGGVTNSGKSTPASPSPTVSTTAGSSSSEDETQELSSC